MNTPEPEPNDIRLLQEALDKVSEHFDAVTILCSRHDPTVEGGTVALVAGRGNNFARYGQGREWILREEENFRQQARNNP